MRLASRATIESAWNILDLCRARGIGCGEKGIAQEEKMPNEPN
jgi:hypothetical protein